MTNYEKYVKAFVDTFEIDEDMVADLEYTKIEAWDSVGHMSLIAVIEETFNIMMDTDDIIDLSSFQRGKVILNERYDVEF